MGFFSKLKEGLQKTRDAMMQKMQSVLNTFTKIDEELFEQLEETMIMSDMGVETSVEICERLRKLVKERGIKNPSEIMNLIEEIISDMMGEETELDLSTKPSVIMVIGVNGAGKTTTIGKLCHQFRNEGKKVLVAAADTFRAAAIEQLEVWTQRAGADIVKHAEGSDPASVVYDAITAAIARECDIVIVDTAGRLQNKKNLMDELAKMNRILKQRAEGCAIETLLVLDATTGQNAVSQARLFNEVAAITGIVLTKLDGTAKGGIVVSIRNELGIPVKLVGVGEKIEDLQRFRNADFVRALFDHPDTEEEEIKISAFEKTEDTDAEDAVTESQAAEENAEISDNPDNPDTSHPKKKKSLFSFSKKEPEQTEEIAIPEEPESAPVDAIAEDAVTESQVTEENAEIPDISDIPDTSHPKKKKTLFSFSKKDKNSGKDSEKDSEITSEEMPGKDSDTKDEEHQPDIPAQDAPKKKKSWFSFGKKGD